MRCTGGAQELAGQPLAGAAQAESLPASKMQFPMKNPFGALSACSWVKRAKSEDLPVMNLV